MNELSNGTAGNREFFEFVVVGTGLNEACGPVDIRRWIFDDNNGDFACGPCASTGIATGHARFADSIQWSAVPVGAIILVYNNLETDAGLLPAADPYDTAPHDSVYVVPSNHNLIQYSNTSCLNTPSALNTCSAGCGGNAGYVGNCYSSTNLWGNVNLRNTGDAVQVRMTDGTYYHGFAYGTAANNMTGGPNNLLNPITGLNLAFFNANSIDYDYRSIANWSSIAAGSATPGVANSTENQAWIDLLRGGCVLPVTYANPLDGQPLEKGNLLRWSTASESGSSHFRVMRATAEHDAFVEIGTVPSAGNTSAVRHYEFLDKQPPPHAFYRLEQVDHSGQVQATDIVEITKFDAIRTALTIWPQPVAGTLQYEAMGRDLRHIQLLDGSGRVLRQHDFAAGEWSGKGSLDMSDLAPGLYFIQLRDGGELLRRKVIHLN